MLSLRRNLDLPKVIAHRGAPLAAPENTIASLQQAKSLGAKWVEFDVRLTLDEQAVIFHDDELSRTTNGKGLVAETTYDDLANLDAGGWQHMKFSHERVPTLAQYLQAAAELGLGINIELKGGASQAVKLAEQVAAGLNQYWQTQLPPPLISSFSIACLSAMRQQNQDCQLGYIVHEWPDDWRYILESNRCISFHVDQKYLTAEKINLVKQTDYLLLAYTINEIALAQHLFSQGVDAIFSDDIKIMSNLNKNSS